MAVQFPLVYQFQAGKMMAAKMLILRRHSAALLMTGGYNGGGCVHLLFTVLFKMNE